MASDFNLHITKALSCIAHEVFDNEIIISSGTYTTSSLAACGTNSANATPWHYKPELDDSVKATVTVGDFSCSFPRGSVFSILSQFERLSGSKSKSVFVKIPDMLNSVTARLTLTKENISAYRYAKKSTDKDYNKLSNVCISSDGYIVGTDGQFMLCSACPLVHNSESSWEIMVPASFFRSLRPGRYTLCFGSSESLSSRQAVFTHSDGTSSSCSIHDGAYVNYKSVFNDTSHAVRILPDISALTSFLKSSRPSSKKDPKRAVTFYGNTGDTFLNAYCYDTCTYETLLTARIPVSTTLSGSVTMRFIPEKLLSILPVAVEFLFLDSFRALTFTTSTPDSVGVIMPMYIDESSINSKLPEGVKTVSTFNVGSRQFLVLSRVDSSISADPPSSSISSVSKPSVSLSSSAVPIPSDPSLPTALSSVSDDASSQPDLTMPCLMAFYKTKEKRPDAIILLREKDSYITCNSDAAEVSEILGTALVSLDNLENPDRTKVLMSSFHCHSLDDYLPKLIRAGKRVCICDATCADVAPETEKPKPQPCRRTSSSPISPSPSKFTYTLVLSDTHIIVTSSIHSHSCFLPIFRSLSGREDPYKPSAWIFPLSSLDSLRLALTLMAA